MSYDEWTPRYRKLVRAYSKPDNGEQCAAYFETLQGFTEGVVERAIAKVISQDKYFPSAAVLRETASGILASATYTPPACLLCYGNLFVPAADQEHFQRSYAYVAPCPDCKPRTDA